MTTIQPKRGFYFTRHDIEQAKSNIQAYPWARQAYDSMKRRCDDFVQLKDEQIYDVILGMKEQTFAYGISGCPDCGKPFPMNVEEQRSMFSDVRELPHKSITCPHCRMSFPNEQYPDEGQGLELHGKGYYLIGMWNFFVAGDWFGGVRDHEGMVTRLTYLYMLTGNEQYAHKALVLLDAFSAILPGTIGPRDFTPYGSHFEIGRIHLLTSIVHRVKVCVAHDYDWLYGCPELDGPSLARQRLGMSGTMRDNIEAMLNDYMLSEPGGPIYDLTNGNLTNLQNHESDGVRAMLAVGLVLDNDDYCQWGIQAVEAYFYNAIGRDGMYYEGSYGYSLFTGSIFLDIALLAMRASDPAQLAAFHPFACSRFFQFAVRNHTEVLCQGHLPCFGDWGRDTVNLRQPDRRLLPETYRAALYFYRFTPDAEMKAEAGRKLAELYGSITEELGARGIDLFFQHPGPSHPEAAFILPQGNTIKGQFGLGIVRDSNDNTLLMRIGQNNTHAHDDALAVQYYSHGKEISADIGYGIYGTNSHLGWGAKTIAHNTVVINKDAELEQGQLYKPFEGGEFAVVYEDTGISVMEAQAPELYGIEAYQRMAGSVSIDEQSSYSIDFFWVNGAETADYAFHAFHESSDLQLQGARPEAKHWTLAGVDAETELYYDKPGLSFGERITTGETFTQLLGDEKLQGWTPQPNNGYGYIYAVEEYKPVQEAVEAHWKSEQGYELVWYGLCTDEDRVFTGKCPNLEGSVAHPVLVLRSEREGKLFASAYQVIRAGADEIRIIGIQGLRAEGEQVTAVKVVLSNGYSDYWIYSPVEQKIRVETSLGEWKMEGRSAWVRLDDRGQIAAHSLIDGYHSELGGHVKARSRIPWITVEEVDVREDCLWITWTLLEEVPPRYVHIRSSNGKSALYPVLAMEQEGERVKIRLQNSLILSRGIVRFCDGNELHTSYPLPLGFNPSYASLSPFAGKTIVGQAGGRAVIKRVIELKKMEIDLLSPFQPDEKFDIVDVAAGDRLRWTALDS
ncbi:heparinase II/III family protein [Paenibacillus sp. J2TS4]|uniref:heparinase II/III domain-containing protein n=1 Tax=Paenibacillus sp. J2TS4 TaxID=2807194 RepID=UPI001BCE3882|nr:heparinase II/III family protein [Paenibacillus sp. J2TS4]